MVQKEKTITENQDFFTEKEIFGLGFNIEQEEDFEEGNGRFVWYSTRIGLLQISITKEFNEEDKLENQYFEISDERFDDISRDDFIKLLQILRNGKSRN